MLAQTHLLLLAIAALFFSLSQESNLSPAVSSLLVVTAAACNGPAETLHAPDESRTLRSDLLDVQSVLSWAADSAKVDCSSLAADSSLAVRGVVARHDIQRSANILSIPRNLTLAVKAGQQSPMPDLVPEKTWNSCDE